METNKKTDESQGKESTADTNATYNRNAEELKNSPTTSQGNASSSGTVGVGGVMSEKDKEGTSHSEQGRKDMEE